MRGLRHGSDRVVAKGEERGLLDVGGPNICIGDAQAPAHLTLVAASVAAPSLAEGRGKISFIQLQTDGQRQAEPVDGGTKG
eukprot:1406822-Alexandrium_andersonii.AAC.1